MKAALGKAALPAFFEDHLDAKEMFVNHADLHLATLAEKNDDGLCE
jgi:hypothetical protein